MGAVNFSLQGSGNQHPYLIAYNLGRISSYTFAGCLAGAIGASTSILSNVVPIEKTLYFASCVMMILLGLYLSGISSALTIIEQLGSAVWKKIQPFGMKFIPVRSLKQAFYLGIIWGWLPCGLVYSVLIAAIASGNPLSGGLIMLTFGIGTLPIMLAMGMTSIRIKGYLQNSLVRKISGLTVMGLGITGLCNLVLSSGYPSLTH